MFVSSPRPYFFFFFFQIEPAAILTICYSSYSLMLDKISKPSVFLLWFFLLFKLGCLHGFFLLATNMPSNNTHVNTIGYFIRRYDFILYPAYGCVYTSEVVIEKCSVKLKNQ